MNQVARSCLQDVFGHTTLRPAQELALRHVLAGRDVLVVMPTGGGKSLCYQLPAAMGRGLTVVVSPLVALMKDQVDALRARGVAAGAWYAGQPEAESAATTRAVRQGQLRLAYLSPERLRAPGARALLARARPERVVVDEAHCVVAWGPEFRPDYLRLAGALAALGDPPVVALTASATQDEQTAILRSLGRPRAARVVAGIDRPELFLAARGVRSSAERLMVLCRALRRVNGNAIVYAPTRGEAERLAGHLATSLGRPAGAYHAGLPAAQRSALQAAFLADRLPILVATSAFGLGVDKADVRAVLVASPPADLSALYQCFGRAGRDGHPALALLVHGPDDFRFRAWQIHAATPGLAELAALCGVLARPGTASPALGEDELATGAGLPLAGVRSAVAVLDQAGVLRRVTPGRWTSVRPPRSGELRWLAAQATARREERLRQLQRVAAYAHATHCRRRDLLAHFGARIEPGRTPCCDLCLAHGRAHGARRRTAPGQLRLAVPVPSNEQPAPAQAGPAASGPAHLEYEILATIQARDGRLTPHDVARLLTAGQAAQHASRQSVLAAVDLLTSAGLLAVYHQAGAAQLALTRRGRSRVEGG